VSQVFEFGGEWEIHPIATWVAVRYVILISIISVAVPTEPSSGIYLYTAAYGVSLGPVAWVLPNEVFPLSMRGKGAALSTASVWTNNCMFRTHCSLSSY
jgi:hypothetical protein